MATNQKWYFAYGSNMLSDVFITRRKIQPLRSEVAVIKTHTLCFNIMGVPYTDPAMGGLRPAEEQDLPVYGVAYLLSSEDMKQMVVSEGCANPGVHISQIAWRALTEYRGGIAYKTELLLATLQSDGSEVNVYTLMARHIIPRSYERLPSARYMGLLIRGASEHSLPDSYQKRLLSQQTFIPGQTCRFKVGKWLFDGFWQRVAYWIEKGVGKYKDSEGNVPPWFLLIFDFLLWTMWYYHDYAHGVIWGRGDGLDIQ